MPSGSSPIVRRSSRARQKPSTYYDDAAKALEEQEEQHDNEEEERKGKKAFGDDDAVKSSKETIKKKPSQRHQHDQKDEKMDDEQSEEEEMESEDNGSEDDDDEETFHPGQSLKKSWGSAKKRKVSPNPSRRNNDTKKTVPNKKKRNIQVKSNSPQNGSKPKKTTATTSSSTGNITKTKISNAISNLFKKVVNTEEETPETSLVAAILSSTKSISGIPSTEHPKRYNYSLFIPTDDSTSTLASKIEILAKNMTLPQLDGIAQYLIRNHEPNAMHIQLLNLLFRSVGGSVETNIAEGTDLEELSDEDWTSLISKIVMVMKDETDADQTLLCADYPPPTPHEQPQKVGLIAYRAMYKEFWYRLGHVLLAHSPSSAPASASNLVQGGAVDDSDDNDMELEGLDDINVKAIKSKKEKSKKREDINHATPEPQRFSSNRFQLEMMRDLVSRMTEVVCVGQPDLRSGATLAIMELGKACLERTVELQTKIHVASRQLKAAKKSNSMTKMETLNNHIDQWKRHKQELEEIVEGPVFQAVFMHRYRDTNGTIRKESLEALSAMSMIRPDVFLVDTYLKYFGWMASDKSSGVRIAALRGLLAPFQAYKEQKNQPSSSSASKLGPHNSSSKFKIDISNMQSVSLKFLPRIVDCTADAEEIQVQEVAMRLLLSMLEEEFLDEWDDDEGWDAVNLKALDTNTSAKVRKDALRFVLEQLDCFDESGTNISEKRKSEQLSAIAGWLANKLCDGKIPVDKIKINLTDCVVKSLLDMPEHRELVLNWPLMLSAVRNENPQQASRGKDEIAKQRILLRILADSAELSRLGNVQSISEGKKTTTKKRKKEGEINEDSLENLSIALLKNLPNLLTDFTSDVVALRDVTKLPGTITFSSLGLPSRKADFQRMLKSLCQLYMDSTDEIVLQNIARVLSKWVEGNHTRVSEVKIQLKRLSAGLQNRLMELFHESEPQGGNSKTKVPGRGARSPGTLGDRSINTSTDMFSAAPEVDLEHSISLSMLRWKNLLMECDTKFLFEKAAVSQEEEDEVEALFNTISEAMGKRLSDRLPIRDSKAQDIPNSQSVATMNFWKSTDPAIHEVVARSVKLALDVLLLIVASQAADVLDVDSLSSTIEDHNSSEDRELLVLRLRNRLVKLLGLCFDQYVDENDATEFTDEQYEFASTIQSHAGRVTSDLRTLFPHYWTEAKDSVRRDLALSEGDGLSHLVGGFARWFQSRELMFRDAEGDSFSFVNEAMAPLCRVTCMNYNDFYRKEAALVLAHILGSGDLAHQTVLSLARVLKKTNPVRMLESHMACLRMAFAKWLDSEPQEPDESSPTEEELHVFEEAEKNHRQLFTRMENLAGKLSQTLGVGKLKDNNLKRSFLGFFKEGIRFSFEGNGGPEDDDFVLGSRLPFLEILVKYSSWIKRDRDHLDHVTDFLLSKEYDLRSHAEFDEVHPDDMKALEAFKESLGIQPSAGASYIEEETTVLDDHSSSMGTPSPVSTTSSRRRISAAGSRGSRSRLSVQSNRSSLSPLYEEDDLHGGNGEEDDSPTPQKRRRLHSSRGDSSVQSSITKSTFNPGTVVEEGDSDEDIDVVG